MERLRRSGLTTTPILIPTWETSNPVTPQELESRPTCIYVRRLQIVRTGRPMSVLVEETRRCGLCLKGCVDPKGINSASLGHVLSRFHLTVCGLLIRL